MSVKKIKLASAMLSVLGFSICNGAYAQFTPPNQIPPPKYSAVDPMGVDLASGQVAVSVDTVSIGGDLGLSHYIRPHTNGFPIKGFRGFKDKYGGSATVAEIPALNLDKFKDADNLLPKKFYVVRVFSYLGQQDFMVKRGGDLLQRIGTGEGQGFSYVPLGDERHKLVNTGFQQFKWTMPDGTEILYSGRLLEKIIHPNGLVEKMHGNSVTNNAGFQLKLRYVEDKRPDNPEVKNFNEDLGTFVTDSSNGWARSNATHVYAINNAYEYCDPDIGNSFTEHCQFDYEWPKATFVWPTNMPKAMSVGENDFKVIGPTGEVTTLHYKAFDVMKVGVTTKESTFPPREGYAIWTARLMNMTPGNREEPAAYYTYENHHTPTGFKVQSYGPGNVTSVLQNNEAGFGAGIYSMDRGPITSDGVQFRRNASTGAHDPNGLFDSRAIMSIDPGMGMTTFYMDKPANGGAAESETYVRFEDNYRNFVMEAKVHGEPKRTYKYSERGNITQYYDEVSGGYTAGGYDDTCQNPKTCNKPTWVKDAKDNQTDYTYKPSTGQVATVTGPADEKGVRPQTRYSYENKYAYYKRGPGNVERAETPISLLTRMAFCRTSAATENGCSESGDEVVTTYDYGPTGQANNLFLRGVTVTADGESRTTCYTYDRLGNKTSETQPKANKTSCD